MCTYVEGGGVVMNVCHSQSPVIVNLMFDYLLCSGFTLKVWISHIHCGKADSKTTCVVLEKTITLSDLAYLGTMVRGLL